MLVEVVLDERYAVTYLEARLPKPRHSVSIIDCKGSVALNYSKVFIRDFGEEELGKPDPNPQEIGCDFHCSPGDSFDVCVLTGVEDQVTVGAMICADREFPEPETQLMLNGAEPIVVRMPVLGTRSEVPGSRRGALDNMVGIATANYPGPQAGNSQAFTCVAWRNGKPQDTLLGRAALEEEILLVSFDVQGIREFRATESWRMDYRRNGPQRGVPA